MNMKNKWISGNNIALCVLFMAILSTVLFIPFIQSMVITVVEFFLRKSFDLYKMKVYIADKEIFIFIFLLVVSILIYLFSKIRFIKTCTDDEKTHLCILICFFFFVMYIHSLWNPNFADDMTVSDKLKNQNFYEYICSVLMTWQSRIIGLFTVILVNLPHHIWRFLDSIFMTVIVECIIQLTIPKGKRKYSYVVCLLYLLVPFSVYNCSGWIMTTTTYVWPLAFTLPVFVILKKSWTNEYFTVYETLCSLILLCLGLTELLIVPVVLVSSILLFCFRIYEFYINSKYDKNGKLKEFFKIHTNRYLIYLFVLSIVFLIFALLNPGNNSRDVVELRWFPEFPALSLLDKLKIGFLITMPYYYGLDSSLGFLNLNLNFILLPLLILLLLNFVVKRKWIMCILQLPGIICLVSQYLQILFSKLFYKVEFINFLKNSSLPQFSIFGSKIVNLELFLYVCIFLILLLSLFFSFDDLYKRILVVLIFLAGFCTRFILCFFPTCYASNVRTTYYMTISIFIVTMYVLLNIWSNPMIRKKVYILGGVYALFILVMIFAVRLPDSVVKSTKLPDWNVSYLQFDNDVDFSIENQKILVLKAWAFYENDDCDLYFKNNGKFYKALRTSRPDAQSVYNLLNSNVGYECRIKTCYPEYSLFLVDKTKRCIFTNDINYYDFTSFTNIKQGVNYWIDNETMLNGTTEIRGWAYHGDDVCTIYIKCNDILYSTLKEKRPDVKCAFSLNNEDCGFNVKVNFEMSDYQLFLVNEVKKEIYIHDINKGESYNVR